MLCYYLPCSFCKIDLKLEVISFTELVFCVQCFWPGEGKIYAEQDGGGGGGGGGSIEQRTTEPEKL